VKDEDNGVELQILRAQEVKGGSFWQVMQVLKLMAGQLLWQSSPQALAQKLRDDLGLRDS
jgi:hypothetical protein